LKIVNNKYIALPGLYKLPIRKYKFIQDLIFIFLFTGIPTSFYAFFDNSLLDKLNFVDLNVIFLIVGLSYLAFNLKHLPKLLRLPGGKALFALTIYLCFQIIYSIFARDINIVEVLTIFRKNFFWPIATLGFLLYIISIEIYRLERVFRIIFGMTIVLGVLFLISNIFNIDFYVVQRTKENLVSNSIVYTQNLKASPRYLGIVFLFGFITTLTTKKYNKHWQWLIGLFVTIILILRAKLVVFALYISVSFTLVLIFIKKISIKNNLKILLVLLLLFILFIIIFPTRINFLVEKFESSLQDQFYYSSAIENLFSTGSFGHRINLIVDAFTRSKSSLLLGNGYIRESTAGNYDFVLGLDTGIAPVIFCEGIIGMIMRWLPIIAILIASIFKLLQKSEKKYALFYIAIIALIVPQFINIIQTKIFVRYNDTIFLIMMLQILIFRDKLNLTSKPIIPQ